MSEYITEWQKVEALNKKGLPKSALEEVEKIYRDASKNNNQAQTIKALLFITNLQQNIEERDMEKSISKFEEETNRQKGASKAILQSITAQLYWNYFQQNRYKLYSRTNTSDIVKSDIATWTADDLNQRISDLYMASLGEEKLLQKTALKNFDPILKSGNSRNLRPTLYDLLAHRALQYFRQDEASVTRPVNAFEMTEERIFAPAKEFSTLSFTTTDTASLKYKGLKILQNLIAFHLTDTNPDAYIEIDLDRLEYAYSLGVVHNKDFLYRAGLEVIWKKHKNNPLAAEAAFRIAQNIYDQALANKNANVKDNDIAVARAKTLAEEIRAVHPKSEGGIKAKNLINEITRPELFLTTEKVNLPSLPFRTLVTYQNMGTISLRLIRLNDNLKKEIARKSNTGQEPFATLIRQNPVKSWTQKLPETNDFLSHTTEIKIDALPVGQYVLLASMNNEFNLGKNLLAAQFFYVSEISFINSGQNYFVLNRSTGHPLPGAQVQVWKAAYDYNSRTYKKEKQATLSTDKSGFITLPVVSKEDDRKSTLLEIKYKQDYLFLDDEQNSYNYTWYVNVETDEKLRSQREYDKKYGRVFFFTDRSIYRPGQPVYFKGIGVSKNKVTQKASLLPNKETLTVILYDANGQLTDSMKVSLNEFGSMQGKFTLPTGKMNGQYSLRVKEYPQSTVYFSVEEYKRPEFFTEFKPIKETFRLYDTVKVPGEVIGYAGNKISQAEISYRVTRIARFIYPWIFRGKGFPRVQPMEIAFGTTTTDDQGRFSIAFPALPDRTLDPSTEPVFDYRIEATIRDIQGETHTEETVVSVGYKPYRLQLDFTKGNKFQIDSTAIVRISNTNLSGVPQEVPGRIIIHALEAPDRLIRERLWQEPDQFIYTKEEYLRYFPHDEYQNEKNPENWKKGKTILDTSGQIKKDYQIQLAKISTLKPGWYSIEVTAGEGSEQVKEIRYFEVYDSSAALSYPAYVWSPAQSQTAEPGETIRITTQSTANDVFLIRFTDSVMQDGIKETSMPPYQTLTLKNGRADEHFSIQEKNRGGFAVYDLFVKDNRFYAVTHTISVPWSNKELVISTDTWRDKTQPGSKETWTMKVAGKKGEKVAAEMLASMYDVSLDQFRPHTWNKLSGIWPVYNRFNSWQGRQNFATVQSVQTYWPVESLPIPSKTFDEINYIPSPYRLVMRGMTTMRQDQMYSVTTESAQAPALKKESNAGQMEESMQADTAELSGEPLSEKTGTPDLPPVQIRKNLQETAFFFPELQTDSNGNIQFSFTMPEALTTWRLMMFAHTKELATGYEEKNIITQKELMIQPNEPRFFREGDQMEFTSKVTNLTDQPMQVHVQLQLINTTTGLPVSNWFSLQQTEKTIAVSAEGSSEISFPIVIPRDFNDAVTYRIIARAGNFSDGEEKTIPVLKNRMLVTETFPLPMRGTGTKQFNFEKLIGSKGSKTLTNEGLTVEFTTNPAWYAVQALPYMMERKPISSEQQFNRFYANALAMKIANSSPRIKELFETWKTLDTNALLSNLQKNEELKSVLLEETPWVLQAQSETKQKQQIALLFDMVKMSQDLESSLSRLKKAQSSNGGFVWIEGGPDDRYMTQYILTGIGHLKKLNAEPGAQEKSIKSITDLAIPYLDKRIKEDYEQLIKRKANLKENQLSALAIQYLYMRSFFPEYKISPAAQTAYTFYREQSKNFWLPQSKYMQGMIALALYRTGDEATARKITASLKENSINNPELGMYWKEWDRGGYWWYQAPIESQALMIEVFSDIDKDSKTVSDLKTWLLKRKQVTNWKTTKATAEAVYALLLQGTDWLSEEKTVQIQLGNTRFSSKDEKLEAGTGYFKRRIDGDKVQPDMGKITVTLADHPNQKTTAQKNDMPAWGAVYWQYFEDLDKITFAETPLSLTKKLFVRKNTEKGPVLNSIKEGDTIHTGDQITVRIELRVDRDMEYVHMKDMRAAALEPSSVISRYQWQGGLGYYMSTRDASTDFFFSWLSKGTYVFEYNLFATQKGIFSNGITTIQSMYAPEFSSHSEGIKIRVMK